MGKVYGVWDCTLQKGTARRTATDRDLQLFEQEENEGEVEALVAAEHLETAMTCLDIAKKAQLHRPVTRQVDEMLEAYGARLLSQSSYTLHIVAELCCRTVQRSAKIC